MTASPRRTQTSIVVDNNESILVHAEETLDDVYGALADERRRRVLYELNRNGSPMDVESLASKVANRESSSPGQASAELQKQVQIALHHQHLPKLDEAGLVNYDRETEEVEKRFREVDTPSA